MDASFIQAPHTQDLVRQIEWLTDRFDAHHAGIEPGFVDLGHHLASVHAAASEVLRVDESFAPSVPARATEHARRVLQHAGSAAYHLQFGDIIRQKFEHVVSALREIDRWLASASTQLDFRLRVTEADCLLAIQSAQLDSIRHDARQVHGHLAGFFSAAGEENSSPALAHAATAGAERLSFLRTFAHDLAQAAEPLRTLRKTLSPWLLGGVDTAALLASYGNRYTMRSEREIHQRLHTVAATDAPGAPEPDVEIF